MRRRVGFHRRRTGLHRHGAGFARDAESDVRHHRHGIANLHVLLNRVEARRAYFQTVVVHRNAVESKTAAGVCYNHLLKTGDRVGEPHLGARNQRAGGIGHLARDGAAVDGLSETRRGRQHGQQNNCPKRASPFHYRGPRLFPFLLMDL